MSNKQFSTATFNVVKTNTTITAAATLGTTNAAPSNQKYSNKQTKLIIIFTEYVKCLLPFSQKTNPLIYPWFLFSCSNFNLWNRFFFFSSSSFITSFDTNKSWMKFFLISSFLVIDGLFLSKSAVKHFLCICTYLQQSIFCIIWIDGYRFRAIVCTFLSILTQIHSHFTWFISLESTTSKILVDSLRYYTILFD